MDTIVTTSDELEVLLKEIFSVINIPDISETALKNAVRWIESKTYGYTVKVLLKTLGTCVVNCKHLAILYEATLTSYFNISGKFLLQAAYEVYTFSGIQYWKTT